MARTAAVTRPNPTAARKSDISGAPPAWPRGSSGQGPELRRRQVADHVDLPARAVGVDLEDAGRAVVAVEVRRAAGALVPDGVTGLQGAGARREGVAQLSAGHAVADLDDVRRVGGRRGALRHD